MGDRKRDALLDTRPVSFWPLSRTTLVVTLGKLFAFSEIQIAGLRRIYTAPKSPVLSSSPQCSGSPPRVYHWTPTPHSSLVKIKGERHAPPPHVALKKLRRRKVIVNRRTGEG